MCCLTPEICGEIDRCVRNSPLDFGHLMRLGERVAAMFPEDVLTRRKVVVRRETPAPKPEPGMLERTCQWCSQSWILARDTLETGLTSALSNRVFVAGRRLLCKCLQQAADDLYSVPAPVVLVALVLACALCIDWPQPEQQQHHLTAELGALRGSYAAYKALSEGVRPETCERRIRKVMPQFQGPATLLTMKAVVSLAPDATGIPAPPPEHIRTLEARIKELEDRLTKRDEAISAQAGEINTLKEWVGSVGQVVQGAVIAVVMVSAGYAVLTYAGILGGGTAVASAAAEVCGAAGAGLLMAQAEAATP